LASLVSFFLIYYLILLEKAGDAPRVVDIKQAMKTTTSGLMGRGGVNKLSVCGLSFFVLYFLKSRKSTIPAMFARSITI
jgi:hypothetical protein